VTTYVALLRGVNMGGHKLVAMADLRDLLTHMGFEDVHSLLQSGNLIFRSARRSGAQLERLLEREAASRLALETRFFVRTAKEWRDVVARIPFPEEAKRDPSHLAVHFLGSKPAATAADALRSSIKGRERIHVDGRQLYAVYPDGFARTRLTTALIDARLGAPSTGRNWNTVLKILAALD